MPLIDRDRARLRREIRTMRRDDRIRGRKHTSDLREAIALLETDDEFQDFACAELTEKHGGPIEILMLIGWIIANWDKIKAVIVAIKELFEKRKRGEA